MVISAWVMALAMGDVGSLPTASELWKRTSQLQKGDLQAVDCKIRNT